MRTWSAHATELRLRAADSATNASRDRFDGPKKLAVHTPGPKRRLLDPEDCDGDAERVFRMYWSLVNQEAARCHELVPTAPNRPDDFYAPMRELSRWHKPKWYEGETELENDWAMEEDYESEEIAMGDQ